MEECVRALCLKGTGKRRKEGSVRDGFDGETERHVADLMKCVIRPGVLEIGPMGLYAGLCLKSTDHQ